MEDLFQDLVSKTTAQVLKRVMAAVMEAFPEITGVMPREVPPRSVQSVHPLPNPLQVGEYDATCPPPVVPPGAWSARRKEIITAKKIEERIARGKQVAENAEKRAVRTAEKQERVEVVHYRKYHCHKTGCGLRAKNKKTEDERDLNAVTCLRCIGVLDAMTAPNTPGAEVSPTPVSVAALETERVSKLFTSASTGTADAPSVAETCLSGVLESPLYRDLTGRKMTELEMRCRFRGNKNRCPNRSNGARGGWMCDDHASQAVKQ